jgi:hypothetical protein
MASLDSASLAFHSQLLAAAIFSLTTFRAAFSRRYKSTVFSSTPVTGTYPTRAVATVDAVDSAKYQRSTSHTMHFNKIKKSQDHNKIPTAAFSSLTCCERLESSVCNLAISSSWFEDSR